MIDLKRFDDLPLPWQNRQEWLALLEFCSAHFAVRGISRPIVVELGVYENRQRSFYVEFLGAEHIGIDNKDEFTAPDIKGDTASATVPKELAARLDGRNVDLLFIDAGHEIADISRDYDLYAGFVKSGIIVLHDLYSYPNSVGKFWADLIGAGRGDPRLTFIEIRAWNSPTYCYGTGLIIRGE